MQIETGHLDIADQNHWMAFLQQYPGDEHLQLACHAAFPVALTPDLLYKIWLNFRYADTTAEPHERLTSVSDLLHSSLCREIGKNIYEMHSDIRSTLLEALQNDPVYGQVRIFELARFLKDYIRHNTDKLPTTSFREAQNWLAESYLQPENAAKIILDLVEQEDRDRNAANKVDFYLSWAKQRNRLHRSTASGGPDILLAIEQIVWGFREYRAGALQEAVEKFRPLEPFFETEGGHGFKLKIPGEVWMALKPPVSNSRTSERALQLIEKAKQARTESLYLKDCGLKEIPAEVLELDWLTDLDLSGNQFEVFPEALFSLKNLRKISLADNRISVLPSKIATMPELIWLDLRGNPTGLSDSVWKGRQELLHLAKFLKDSEEPVVFLFCLGGTGARVLKSLVFLLAAGADLKASKVVPIIIDTDSSNGDLQRTLEVINSYQKIRRQLEFTHNGFFKTDIRTLAHLVDEPTIAESFRFDVDVIRDIRFQDFIGYNTMPYTSRALTDALFSEEDLLMELGSGFKGNPHIGSIVLNQFKDSWEFKFFASHLRPQDRIFIVSSTFGGTGAAGFPLLVSNIRAATEALPNYNRLRNAPVGAIVVTPYFGIEPGYGITNDKNAFIDKTKAALEYYSNHVTGNSALNALYYIGDQATKDYKPATGQREQTNDAHVIELFSALSIFDFMNLPKMGLDCSEGRAVTPYFKEYGVREDNLILNLRDLGSPSKQIMLKPFTQYALAVNYWRQRLPNAFQRRELWASRNKSFIKQDFLSSPFYHQLQAFNKHFAQWLAEMARNTRSLQAFNLDTPNLHTLVNGYVPMRKNFFGGERPDEWGHDDYTHELNSEEVRLPAFEAQARFMALFYKTTEKIVRNKFKNLSD